MKRLALVPFLIAGGCSWASFDNLSKETWVDSVGAPSGANTNKFGANVMGTSVRSAGAHMLVLGRDAADVSSLSYDENGIASQNDGGDVLTQLQFTHFDDTHPAMAAEPGTGVVAFTLVTRGGVNTTTDPDANTKVVFYDAAAADAPKFVKQIEPPTGGDGLKANKLATGLAFGELNPASDPAHSDVVVARDDQIMIISDWALPQGTLPSGAPSTFAMDFCKHQEPTALSVALGEFDAASAGVEILLATGPRLGDTGASKIKIIAPQTVLDAYPGGTAPVTNCFMTQPELGEIDKTADGIKDLGKQMLVADFGTGPMIIASAPQSNRVFAFFGDKGTTEATLLTPPGAGTLGDSLAVGDLDGDGVPELAVGDSKATANGVSGAGSVFVFKFNATTTTFDLIATLHDAQPTVEQHFGTAVAIVPFGTGTPGKNILVAADEGEVFTYFRLHDVHQNDIYPMGDVRAGHQ